MTKIDFALYLDRLMGRIRDLLVSKGAEYQQGNDNVFHNFEVSGQFLGCSSERALLGYLAKHLISVRDIVSGIDHGCTPPHKVCDEKIMDGIAYLFILHAMVCTDKVKD